MQGATLDKQIQAYLTGTREAGGVVCSEVCCYSSCDEYCLITGPQSKMVVTLF